METKIIRVSANDDSAIADAAEILRRGGLVAFPTETVYGLGADASNAMAVAKIFEAKGRPADNPLIVHIATIEQFVAMGKTISTTAMALAKKFWPGPLTLVVEHRGHIPSIVTAELPTVAVRMPNHPVALALIKNLGCGIVGPSANRSGRPSPTTAQHVYDDLNGNIDIILDDGPTRIGVESTVVDVTVSPPVILRLGGLTRESIEAIVGQVRLSTDIESLKRSPGTRHRHYAPSSRLELIHTADAAALTQALQRYAISHLRIGCMLHSETLFRVARTMDVEAVHLHEDEYAAKLFSLLRSFETDGVDIIIVEEIPEIGIGEAVMDRLRRAAEK